LPPRREILRPGNRAGRPPPRPSAEAELITRARRRVLTGIRKKSQNMKPAGDRKAGATTASGAFGRRCLIEAVRPGRERAFTRCQWHRVPDRATGQGWPGRRQAPRTAARRSRSCSFALVARTPRLAAFRDERTAFVESQGRKPVWRHTFGLTHAAKGPAWTDIRSRCCEKSGQGCPFWRSRAQNVPGDLAIERGRNQG